MGNKRKGGALSRLKDWVVGEEITEHQAYVATGNPAVSQWPAEYDDIPFEGVKIVRGTHCRTPAEYKTALTKKQIGLY